MRRSLTIVAALAAVVTAGVMAIPAGVAGAGGPATKFWVSPSTVVPGAGKSCARPGYNSIQAAINVAPSGATIEVCTGTFAEQLSISTASLKVKGVGAPVVKPTSSTANASSLTSAEPIVAIVRVAPGANVNISGLTIDGSQIEAGVNGCSTNLVGVLYQATAGHNASGTVSGNKVQNITPTNSGCGAGQAIFVQSDTTGTATASVSLSGNTVSGYGKTGILCNELGTACAISGNTITTSATATVAQNGVQVGFGATGSLKGNTITGNDWNAADPGNPQPQGNYAAGILLYAAGINAGGATINSTSVTKNTLTDNEIGVQVVDSAASVKDNNITETGSGIPNSIGIYGVGCDEWCGYFNDNNGAPLNTVASSTQAVTVMHNTVNFTATPAGSHGIWLGDNSWSADLGYGAYGPAGIEHVTVKKNPISNVATLLTIGGGAIS